MRLPKSQHDLSLFPPSWSLDGATVTNCFDEAVASFF